MPEGRRAARKPTADWSLNTTAAVALSGSRPSISQPAALLSSPSVSPLGMMLAMRKLAVPAADFTDRIDQAQQLVASRDHTPASSSEIKGSIPGADPQEFQILLILDATHPV
jgi:hypothetical protein